MLYVFMLSVMAPLITQGTCAYHKYIHSSMKPFATQINSLPESAYHCQSLMPYTSICSCTYLSGGWAPDDVYKYLNRFKVNDIAKHFSLLQPISNFCRKNVYSTAANLINFLQL
jgi:hypothetical protein